MSQCRFPKAVLQCAPYLYGDRASHAAHQHIAQKLLALKRHVCVANLFVIESIAIQCFEQTQALAQRLASNLELVTTYEKHSKGALGDCSKGINIFFLPFVSQ